MLFVQLKPIGKPQDFRRLLSGRVFLYSRWANVDPEAWIKLDKNFAQPLSDNNGKCRFKQDESIQEVHVGLPESKE